MADEPTTPFERAAAAVMEIGPAELRFHVGPLDGRIYEADFRKARHPHPVLVPGAKTVEEAHAHAVARAVIAAIREPSGAMTAEGTSAYLDNIFGGNMEAAWQAMIDAALAEGE